MGLNDTSSAQRVHIGFFGRRNSGKSSLVNAVTGQALSVVSDVLGTTTDPVQKSMELLPIGPVLIIDTPGMDDEGELGQLRVEKTRQILRKTDVAVVVMSAVKEPSEQEKERLRFYRKEKYRPYWRSIRSIWHLSRILKNGNILHREQRKYLSVPEKRKI